MDIHYRFEIPGFWPAFGRSILMCVLWCVVCGYVGLLLGMAITRRGFSEMSGFMHVALFVPLSSAVVGGIIWLVIWGLLQPHATARSLESFVVITSTAVACVIALAVQVVAWILIVKLGGQ